jgi:PKD repeat protein
MTGKKNFQAVIVLMLLLGAPVAAFAQDEPPIVVTTSVSCDSVYFTTVLQGGIEPYTVRLEFGDTEVFEASGLPAGPFDFDDFDESNEPHIYPHGGDFNWTLIVTGSDSFLGEAEGTVTIDGPTVTLGSNPSLPLLTIDGGEASIKFIPSVTDGVAPYFYSWDLDEDGLPDAGLSGDTATYTYTAGGNYKAAVTVTDSGTCGLSHTDTLTVVVVDPEANPQDACHPTAQKIAEAVSIIFLKDRAEQTYTCEDIFNIFEGALLGNHIGFGRLWHAYQLTQTIDDLTWEEIRDWGLDGSSWGAITQLNRFADTLTDYGIRELFDLVVNGDNSVGEIRTAARASVRYEADFEDALAKISEGANPGELGQFYKLAAEIPVNTDTLDQYLADGMSLSELSHAAKMAERLDVGWEEVITAKGSDHSWGDIGQAYKLAGYGISAANILALEGGVQAFRAEQRDADKLAREDARAAARKETLDEKTADRLSKQYEFTGDMDALLAECEGNWGCVRKKLKNMDQAQVEGTSDKDLRTAERLFAQYGVDLKTIWLKYNGICGEDWNCVRAELREMTRVDKKDK